MQATVGEAPPPTRTPTPGFFSRLHALFARRETIYYLTAGNLKAGHRDKALGHLWNLLDPALFMLVYYFIFGILFGQVGAGAARTGEYMLHLFVGLVVWRFLTGAVSQSANVIRSQRALIHAINFPKSVFPVSHCLATLYDFLWGLLVVGFVLVVFGDGLKLQVLWIIPGLAILVMFGLGMGFIVAYLGTFYADTSNVLNVVMRLWFYCSPILYYVRGPHSRFAGSSHQDLIEFLFMLNPAACILALFYDPLLSGAAPEPQYLIYATVISAAIFVSGFELFTRFEGKFIKYV